jgi:hypothetical protein
MDGLILIVVLLVVFSAAEAVVMMLFVHDLRTQRANRETPVVAPGDVGEAQVGRMVAVTGELVTEAPLASPITGADCAWYSLKVNHRRKGARYETTYTDVRETAAADCRIADAAGSLRLGDLKKAEVTVDKPEHFLLRSFEDQFTEHLERVILHYPKESLEHNWQANGKLTFSQQQLPPGTRVYVRGIVRKDGAGLLLDSSPDGRKKLWLCDLQLSDQGKHFGCMRIVYVSLFAVFGLAWVVLVIGLVGRLSG